MAKNDQSMRHQFQAYVEKLQIDLQAQAEETASVYKAKISELEQSLTSVSASSS